MILISYVGKAIGSTIPSKPLLWLVWTINHWLVVSTPLKNISWWEGLSQILWKIKNVPNHQPDQYRSFMTLVWYGLLTFTIFSVVRKVDTISRPRHRSLARPVELRDLRYPATMKWNDIFVAAYLFHENLKFESSVISFWQIQSDVWECQSQSNLSWTIGHVEEEGHILNDFSNSEFGNPAIPKLDQDLWYAMP